MLDALRVTWHDEEAKLLQRVRARRQNARRHALAAEETQPEQRSLGARVSDNVAAMVGSWPFIIIQSVLLLIWMTMNVVGYIKAWDPYPFILLNLVLSFQAAYTAPIIMMSQNRQSDIDRLAAKHDYDVNLKSELEIELLHQKVDLLREQQIAHLVDVIQELKEDLRRAHAAQAEVAAAAISPPPTNVPPVSSAG
jgi:uncharacterized membrane protein